MEYSTCSPFNCDTTRLLLIKQDHFQLLDGDGKFIKDLAVSASAEPRWSRVDPKSFYYLSGMNLYRWTENLQPQLIQAFSEYTSVSGRGESEISLDGNHLVLCGTRPNGVNEVFVYDIPGKTKGLVVVQSGPFDGLKIDARNRALISGDNGIYLLEPGVSLIKITPANGHAAVTRYKDRDKLLWCTSNDPAINKNAVAMVDLDTGAMDILCVLDWKYSFHIATCDKDWCVVSTDCPTRDLPSQCLKVYYDKTVPVEVICDAKSVYVEYNSQVKAALSRDGSRLVGCSNFGDTKDPNYCDVFMVKLAGIVTPVQPPPPTRTRIDYSQYVHKSRFIMEPRSDGAVDIWEEKL